MKLEAVVAYGDDLKGHREADFPYGVDTIYKAEDKRLYPYTSLPHSSLLINLFREIKPQIAFTWARLQSAATSARVSAPACTAA